MTLNGRPFRKIAAREPAVNVLEGIKLGSEGVYRFGFRSPDGKVTGTSNPIWAQRNPAAQIYWGENHTHTGMAQGQGSIESKSAALRRYQKWTTFLRVEADASMQHLVEVLAA